MNPAATCQPDAHDYRAAFSLWSLIFGETTIFCRKCGDTKEA